tara:strand:- start:60 stop:1001 length:942 start_codon:yes stop_codon:yes gene_type:complete
MKLGNLEQLDLRKQWKGEATDFTPWLAKEENIKLLGDVLHIELELEAQEKNVGAFKADILCKDTINDNYVLIENQLEKTDHNHLGQLMTYAAGLNAVTIVWIAAKVTEEHRAALDWLNRITDEDINFFGIEIELYKIGNSVPAPKFSIVSKPNDWSKTIKRSVASGKITDTKLFQQEYWQALKDYIESTTSFIRPQKPLPQHWTNIAIGRSYFHIVALVNSRDNKISIFLCISGTNAKKRFHALRENYEKESLKALGKNLEWRELPDAKESHVRLVREADIFKRTEWGKQHKWFKDNIEKFHQFFAPKVKKVN